MKWKSLGLTLRTPELRPLTQVTEASASLFELMQDIVLRGGWVEPDITWPRLCCTQVMFYTIIIHYTCTQVRRALHKLGDTCGNFVY